MVSQQKPGDHQYLLQPKELLADGGIYGPVKAAIAKFSEHAAIELARYGIRVLSIAPGYTDVGWPVDDPIHEPSRRSRASGSPHRGDSPCGAALSIG